MEYFDHNATSPLIPAARDAMHEAQENAWHNPASPYRAGARVHALLEQAREDLAAYLGCPPELIIFTSGATEANNAFLAYLSQAHPHGSLALSAVEHPCVLEPAKAFFPGRHHLFPVDARGVLKLGALREVLARGDLAGVALMAANNETGVLQPWQKASELCRARGVLLHVDAAQWLGKLPARGLGACDAVTGCAHKFGGPRGVGFLKIPAACRGFRGQLRGGQENGHRGGTVDYPAVAGMLAALKAREEAIAEGRQLTAQGRDHFTRLLHSMIDGVRVVGEEANRLWNTISLVMPEGENTRWVGKLDKRGFAVSTGSACATAKEGPSHVLAAQGYGPEEARRTVRVSGGWETTMEQWEALAEAFADTWAELRSNRQGDSPATVIHV